MPQDDGVDLAYHDNYLTDDPTELNDDAAHADGVRDITVTYTGNIAASVRMFATGVTGSAGDVNIRVTVDDEAEIYNGPLSGLGSSWATSDAELLLPAGSSPQAHTFNITITQAGMPAGQTAEGIVFHWEAQQP